MKEAGSIFEHYKILERKFAEDLLDELIQCYNPQTKEYHIPERWKEKIHIEKVRDVDFTNFVFNSDAKKLKGVGKILVIHRTKGDT